MAIIGIDLGTTNSLACVYRDGKAELIPNELGEYKTSSAVSVLEDGTVLVGTAAKERLVSHPESTAASFKIWMGTNKPLTLGNRQFKPEELSALVLRQLLEDARRYLDEPVEEAVISVPAYFNDDQRCATKLAAQLAGLTVKRLINEPSAAALYYRYSTQSGDGQRMIVDFGGGTLDVSIVDCFENIIEITSIAGDNRLGGDDIDRAIAAHFCRENGLTEDRLEPSLRASLYRQSEMAKIALSGAPAASISLRQGAAQYSLVLTNDVLRMLCQPVFQKVRTVIGRAMKDQERSDRIRDVILVGGSAQLTVFGDFLEELFGRRPRVAACPDEIVAMGVGLCAGIKERAEDLQDLVMTDVCPFSLGVSTYSHAGDRTLFLFEQLSTGRQLLRDGLYEDVNDAEAAAALARQLLEETLCPPEFPMDRLANLPDAVYSMPDFNVVCRDKDAPPLWSTPTELTGEAVTREKLRELLELFFNNRVERLELSWRGTIPMGEEQDYEPRRSLVLLKGGGGYACLYFDDFRAKSYALLEKPELYGKVDQPLNFVPFRQGRLFSHVIHRNLSGIRRRLGDIFNEVSRPGNVNPGGIWSYAVNVDHGRHKYNLDKQLLGGFPAERSHNRADAPFYFSLYPDSAAYVDGEGNVEALRVSETERFRLQALLAQFLREEGRKLRLTWGKKAGRRRHIVLLRDGGRFLMAWIQEEKQTAKYHVADVGTYMDVEGKKYPKDTFRGRTTPAYLIHGGVISLRGALERLRSAMKKMKKIGVMKTFMRMPELLQDLLPCRTLCDKM